MARKIQYLVECSPYDPGLADTRPVNFSYGLTEEYFPGKTDPYPVRLKQAFTHETGVFDQNLPGGTTISVGSCIIGNTDGRMDWLLELNWDGRSVVVKRGYEGDAYATFVTEFTGSALEIMADRSDIVINLRDNSYKLVKAIQENKYLGTGGMEGTLDLRSRPKPLAFGPFKNVAPVILDPARLVFQIHDGVMGSVTAVYDKGIELADGGDFASYAALIAANITPGFYATCLASGLVRLGAKLAGNLTIDGVGALGSATTIPDLAKAFLISDWGGLVLADLDETSFTDMATDAPWDFQGVYLSEPTSQRDELLETLMAAVNGFWLVKRDGKIAVQLFKFETPTYSVRAEDIHGLQRIPSPSPLNKVIVNYDKNPTIMGVGDFNIQRETLNGYLKDNKIFVDTEADGSGGSYTYEGEFEVFLNDTKINDLTTVQFSVENSPAWIVMDADGTFTVSNPGVDEATATIKASIGEFSVSELFTLKKSKEASAKNMVMTTTDRRFIFDDSGVETPAAQSAVITATLTNVTTPLSWVALDNLGNAVTLTGSGNSRTLAASDIINSPLVSWVLVNAISPDGTYNNIRIIVQRGENAYASGLLGTLAAVDGVLDIYYQDSAPSGAKLDDLWFDTNDGNKVYRYTGVTWVAVDDTRIAQALTDAATAQGTADGKVKTFLTESTPTATGVGDLWYRPSTHVVSRWDGSAWITGFASLGAQLGDPSNFPVYDEAGVLLTNSGTTGARNNAVSIGSNGQLSGGGGGQVSIGGLGFTGNLNADNANTIVGGGGVVVSGNQITRSGGGPDYDQYAYTRQMIRGSGFVAQIISASAWNMVGLSSSMASAAPNGSGMVAQFQYVTTGGWAAYVNGVVVNSGTTTAGLQSHEMAIAYDGAYFHFQISGTILHSQPTTADQALYPMWVAYTPSVTFTGLRSSLVRSTARLGWNVVDSAHNALGWSGSFGVGNNSISIAANGALSGAGGGQVTIRGVGYLGDLNASADITLRSGSNSVGTHTFAGNTVTKTSVTQQWDAFASSKESFTGSAAVAFLLPSATAMAGLTTTPNGSAVSPSTAQYAASNFNVYRTSSTWIIYHAATGNILDMGTSRNGVTFGNLTLWQILYDGTQVSYYADGVLMHSTSTNVTAGMTLYASAVIQGPQNNSVVGISLSGTSVLPKLGLTMTDASGNVLTNTGTYGVLNSSVTVGANGALSGAGGGQVTIGGLGFTGDLAADRNLNLVAWGSTSLVSGNGIQRSAGDSDYGAAGYGAAPYTSGCFVSSTITNSVWNSISLDSDLASLAYTSMNANMQYHSTGLLQIFINGVNVVNTSGYGNYQGREMSIVYDGSYFHFHLAGSIQYSHPTTSGQTFYPVWHAYTTGVVYKGFRAGHAYQAARLGFNVIDSAHNALGWSGSYGIGNPSVSIAANGALSGAGGGQVTFGGLGGGAVGQLNSITLGSGGYLRDTDGTTTLSAGMVRNSYRENSVTRVVTPMGGAYANNSGAATGAVRIKLPLGFVDYMIRFDVEIYEYQSGKTATYTLAGYPYKVGGTVDTWISTSAQVRGEASRSLPVRFGSNGGMPTIWIGALSDVRAYPQIRVTNVIIGYNNDSVAQWESGWQVLLDTGSFDNITSTITQPTSSPAFLDNNMFDVSGNGLSTSGTYGVRNAAISVAANGALSGGGGGQVTIGGLGYVGSLTADTTNRFIGSFGSGFTVAGNSMSKTSGGDGYSTGLYGEAMSGSYFVACTIPASGYGMIAFDAALSAFGYADMDYMLQVSGVSWWFYVSGALITNAATGPGSGRQMALVYDATHVHIVMGGNIYYSYPVAANIRMFPVWHAYSSGVTVTDLTAGQARAASRLGYNIYDNSLNQLQTTGTYGIFNTAISMGSNGALSGGGGGQVTPTGLGLEDAADVTKTIGYGPAAVEIVYNYDGTDKDGQLPKSPQYKMITAAGTILTSGVTWTYLVTEGTLNGYTLASGAQAMSGSGTGTLTITSMASSAATVEVKGVILSRTYVFTLRVVKRFDLPPTGGSGAGGTSATDSTFLSINSTTWTAISGSLTATVATGATTAALTAAGLVLTPEQNSTGGNSGTWNVELKWQRDVAGVWTDVGSSTNSDPDPVLEYEGGTFWYPYPGEGSCNVTNSSLTGGSSYTWRLMAKLTSGTKRIYITGSCTVQG